MFRKALIAAVAAGSLAGCSTAQFTQLDTITTSFIASVQSEAALACKIIPTVDSIVSIFNAAIGQTAGAIAAIVCAASPPPASARFRALPPQGYSPVVIGKTPGGIVISGWRA